VVWKVEKAGLAGLGVSRETNFDAAQEIAHCAQNPIFVWIILWKLSTASRNVTP
jgi:hypothetical protein